MPRLDGAVGQIRFPVAPGVDFDHLLDRVVEGLALEFLACQPFLERGGGDVLDLELLGHGQSGIEHVHHRVFILRVKRVGSAHHHDEVYLELERLHALHQVLQILGVSSGKEGDLRIVYLDG